MIDAFLHAALMMTTPILLAAIGGLVNRIGGLVNLGLESMMLAGALVAVIVSAKTGSSALATFAALGMGAVVGLAMSLVITRLSANEVIVGLGFTVATAGFVRFFLKSIYGVSGTYNPPGVAMLQRFDIPFLDSVPMLGAIFSGQDALTWLAWALVPATAFVLQQTRGGLRLRATGAAETTVRAVGLAPLSIRDASTVICRRTRGPRRRASLDRCRRAFQRRHYRRPRLHRACSFLLRTDIAFSHRAWRSAVRSVRRCPDPPPGSRRAGRTCPDAALRHCHHRAYRTRALREARPARQDPLMSSTEPNAQPKTALVLVDVTNSFFLAGMPNFYPASAEALEPLRALLARARSGGRIVVHAVEQHYPGYDDYEWRKLPRHHFIGDKDAEFFEGFEPEGTREIVCAKRRYSAFFATDLALFLREQGVERVVIAGVKTNVCIRATVQDAFANGFDAVVPREATNSNRPHLAEASLEDIQRYFGEVVPLERALEMLG